MDAEESFTKIRHHLFPLQAPKIPSTESSRHPISITYMITTEAMDTSWGGKEPTTDLSEKDGEGVGGGLVYAFSKYRQCRARLLERSKVRVGDMSGDNSLSYSRTL